MNIYFVRHGETESNRKGIHQGPDVPLSEHGMKQIGMTAEKLRELHATKLISSDLLRARQSAEIISGAVGLPIEEIALFREVRRPSNLYGKPHIGIDTLMTGMSILYHFNDRDWHYKDEENFFDIEARVEQAVIELKRIGEEHDRVIVVSHAFIINMFVAYMCRYKRVRRRDYLFTLFSAKFFDNASITTVTYNDDHNPNTCDWICLSINDTSHLSSKN